MKHAPQWREKNEKRRYSNLSLEKPLKAHPKLNPHERDSEKLLPKRECVKELFRSKSICLLKFLRLP